MPLFKIRFREGVKLREIYSEHYDEYSVPFNAFLLLLGHEEKYFSRYFLDICPLE